MRRMRRPGAPRHGFGGALAAATLLVAGLPVPAQPVTGLAPAALRLEPQPLGDALRALAKQADLQILFAPALVEGRRAPAVSGALTARGALDALLEGTGLLAEERGPNVFVVRLRPSSNEGASVARSAAPGSPAPTLPLGPRTDLEEIVVTAQRRLERLQDVPISVTVHDRKTMDARGARAMDDVARLTPGVSYVRSANNNNAESSDVAIRGIASNAGASTTGVYVDDTPIHGRHLSFPSFNTYPALFDVERVEVLRGPQGTLFGAGSQGGTIRFISPEPSLESASLYARAEAAITERGAPTADLGVAGGAPLIAGRLAWRASVSQRREGGYVDRVDWHRSRTVAADANDARTSTARLAVRWAASDALTVTPSIVWQQSRVDDTSAYWVPRAGEPDPTGGQFASPLRSGNAIASPNTDRFVLPAVKLVWNLGAARLVSSTSWFSRTQRAVTDYSQFDRAIFLDDPYPPAGEVGIGYWADEQRNWTQEVRLESTRADARATWTVGLFWQRAQETTRHRVYDPDILVALGVPPTLGDGFIYVEDPRVGIDRQLALFGQTDVALTPALDLTLGLRYAHAEFEGRATYPETLVVGSAVSSRGRQQEWPLTPKVGLKYRLGAERLVYATAAKGYRIGGVNPRVGQFCYGPGGSLDQIGLAREPPTYDSDTLWSYELGGKGVFAGGRVLANASAFYIRWRDIQQNVGLGCGFQFTSNLGAAESRGFDVQLALRPSERVSLGATLAYTSARFTRDVQLQPTVQSIVRDGDHLATPPWSVAAFAQWDVRLAGRSAYVRVDHEYAAAQTERVPPQNPLNGNYALWFEGLSRRSSTSVRAGVAFGRLDVSAFVQNAFDARPRLTALQDIATPTGGTPLFYSITFRPRTAGITATYRY